MRRGLPAAVIVLVLVFCALGCGAVPDFGNDGYLSPDDGQSGTSAESTRTTEASTTTTTVAEPICFVVPIGSGQGEVGYVLDDPCENWGPSSFCVLPDQSVAILDIANHRIQVFDRSGALLDTVDLGMTITPLDVRWWNGCFAVWEDNVLPKQVLLVSMQGQVTERIELPGGLLDGCVTDGGGLRIGVHGELEFLETCGPLYQLTDEEGRVCAVSHISTVPLGFEGGPEFEMSSEDGGPGRVRLAGSSNWLVPLPGSAGGACPVASDAAGNTYFVGSHVYYDSAGDYTGSKRVVVRLDARFEQMGFARIDTDGVLFYPSRMLDVTADGAVYSMVAKKDGLHIDTLVFSSALP